MGKARALGVTSLKRSPRLPDVPTIDEAGVPGFDVSSWYGMCAPAAVDKTIQRKIEVDTLKLLATADVRQRLHDVGVDVDPQNAAEFSAFARAETAKWIKVAKISGIEPQ
jgi:tripartite-type tricarboxylate transporter receptor subunit TctC